VPTVSVNDGVESLYTWLLSRQPTAEHAQRAEPVFSPDAVNAAASVIPGQ
jgi:hypothetical protein